MFLPEISVFARLCGVSSLGELLLPSEKKGGRGEHGSLHKILREVLNGQPVSKKRIDKFNRAFIEHFLGDDPSVLERANAVAQEAVSSAPAPKRALREEVNLDIWYQLYQSLPEDQIPRTKQHLYRLLVEAQAISNKVREAGPGYLLEKAEQVDDPIWTPLCEHLSGRLEDASVVPEDVLLIFSVTGVLGLLIVWIVEGVEQLEMTHEEQKLELAKYVQLLFAEEDGQADPKRSVAKLLEYAFRESGCETKMQFICQAFGGTESQIREAKRFFSGTAIPSHAQTMAALERGIVMDEYERGWWVKYVAAAQFMARSSRRLEEFASGPIIGTRQPHVRYHEVMRTSLAGKSASSSSDQIE